MRTTHRIIIFETVLCLAAVLGGPRPARAGAPSITATLDPAEIALGDSAQLTVTIQGQNQEPPAIPEVSGLTFQPIGQASQVQVINGAMSVNLSRSYAVTPDRLGTFTIPRIRLGSGSAAAATQPLVLKVLRNAAAAPSASTQNQQPLPPPAGRRPADDSPPADPNSFGFLRILSPKQQFYVGETVPVELKACFRAGAELRVDGLPLLNSDAFTMNKLSDQPARTQQVLGGIPYTVFTWQTAVTAVKAGDYALSVQIPTTVTVRQRLQRLRGGNAGPFGDAMMDEFFNDSFFQQFFGAATQKQVTLGSEPQEVQILALPAENRPAGFTGAVGRFELAAQATPQQTAAGDPVTLTLRITGAGNFDRVSPPAIATGTTWKTYQSSTRFEPADRAAYAGTKSFEQPLVPLQSGKLEIPALAFSYFDPEKKQYFTRTSSPITIEVAPGQVAAASAPQAPAAAGALKAAPATSPGPDLVPNKPSPGSFSSTLRPWILNPWLVAAALSPAAALLLLRQLVRRRQRLLADPDRLRAARTRQAVQAQLQAMQAAAARGAVQEFFAAARSALQAQLALRWGVAAPSITLAEVNARMNGEAQGFRFIFELADEVTYTGRTFPAAALREWLKTVHSELKKLEST
jgi:hypothetical protein